MIWIMIGVVLLVLLGASFALAYYLVYPNDYTLEAAQEDMERLGFWRDFDALPKQEYLVTARDGYQLHTMLVPAAEPSNHYVIISHGYGYNRCGSVKYLHMFRDLGFHCVLYDNRGHGLNPPCVCTMGLRESDDLLDVLADTYRRYGQDIRVGLHGESMGAALTVMALGKKPRVAFAVIDCSYSNLTDVVQTKAKTLFGAPKFLCYPGSLICRLAFGYGLWEVKPARTLTDNKVPVCFFHGENDKLIHYRHSVELSRANGGYCELHLFPGAEHARCIAMDEDRYRRIVKDFLDKCYFGEQHG